MNGKTKFITWFALVIVVVIAVAGTMFVMSGADFSKMFVPKKAVTTTEITECLSTTSSTLTVSLLDKYSDTATSVNYAYRINGGGWTTGTASSISIAGSPGNIVDIELAPDNTSYYGENKYGIELPCKMTSTLKMYVSTVATNSITSTVWNDDGSVNSATVAEALGAGEVKNVQIRFIGEYKKDYGNPYGLDSDGYYNILTCPFNNTVFDDLNIAGASVVKTPNQQSLTTGNFIKSWKIPILHSNMDNAGSGFTNTMSMDTDDTNQPTVAHNITCTLYDPQRYYDSTPGTLKYLTGVEDENNGDVGIGTEETLVIYTS